MKRIILIGINHYDPFGRIKIHNLLLQLKNERDFIPDFIAVEWKEDYAKRIISQRPLYQKLLSDKYPKLSHADVLTLANSLAYEADSHCDLYPEMKIIWLDNIRTVEETLIDNYAQSTLRVHEHNLYYANISDPHDLKSFSIAAHYASDKAQVNGGKRDAQFFQVTCASSHENANIIGILGMLHVDRTTPNRYANLLLNAGYEVESIRIDAS